MDEFDLLIKQYNKITDLEIARRPIPPYLKIEHLKTKVRVLKKLAKNLEGDGYQSLACLWATSAEIELRSMVGAGSG